MSYLVSNLTHADTNNGVSKTVSILLLIQNAIDQRILDGIKKAASSLPDADWQTEFRLKHNILTDAEAQKLIAAVSNNFSNDFFYTNHSSLTLPELKLQFCKLFPSVGVQSNPMVLCGYKDNEVMKPVARGIHMRKVNLRAIPKGRNRIRTIGGSSDGVWYKSYPSLPKAMAFDVDETDNFKTQWGAIPGYQIHEAHDIPRPFVITINPVSMNCHFLYEIKWTFDDKLNPQKAYAEYESIRRELTALFGADPGFTNHVIRSPFFIAAHHRNNPEQLAHSRGICIDTESLYHQSIWFEPHAYTLTELRGIVAYLKKLHPEVGRDVTEIDALTTTITSRRPTTTYSMSNYQQLANTPAWKTQEGQRNCWVFANLSKFCRGIAGKYRKTNDSKGFLSDARVKAEQLNSQLESPLPIMEIQSTVRSVVHYCLSNRYRPLGRSSDEARFINRHFRWGTDHVSVKMKAKSHGMSRSTYYRKGLHLRPAILDNRELLNGASQSHFVRRNDCGIRELFTSVDRNYISRRNKFVNDHRSHIIPSDRDCLTYSLNWDLQYESVNEARGPPY